MHLFLLSGHKIVPPAMEFLLQDGAAKIDGFICPGHVSTIIGAKAYEPLVKKYGVPCVVAGFEPTDILQAVLMLLMQLDEGRAEVENQYQRAVRAEGNPKALAMIDKYCQTVDPGRIVPGGVAVQWWPACLSGLQNKIADHHH